MGNGRPCVVCSLPFAIREAADQKLTVGESPRHVNNWLAATHNVTISERNVYNHRARHLRLIHHAVTKIADAQRMQQKQIEVARAVVQDEAFDPVAYLQVAAISQDIRRTSDRLEGAAVDAYATRQHSALANLSGQLLRSHELRGKLGGTIQDGAAVAIQVNLNDLSQKVLTALDDDPVRRRQVAAALLEPVKSSAIDIGISPSPGTAPAPRDTAIPSPTQPPTPIADNAASAAQTVDRAWAILSAAGITAAQVDNPTPADTEAMRAVLRDAGLLP